MLQAGFTLKDHKTDFNAMLEKTLLDTTICPKQELCRSFRIPAKFKDFKSFKESIGKKFNLTDDVEIV
jgi:hypothetical protein